MTEYKKGFLSKCAEAGLSSDEALLLYKRASILTALEKLFGRGLQGAEGVLTKSRGIFGENAPGWYNKLRLLVGRTGYRMDPEHAWNALAKRRGGKLPFPNESIWHYLD